jgi:HAD superfamily hydrolase (TIGR01549 family)
MSDIRRWFTRHSNYDVYSFDVFDTLLRRRIDPPELIKCQTAKYLSTRLAQRGITLSPDEVLRQRSRCEELLLRRALSRGKDADYCLDDVMTETLKALKTDSALDTRQTINYEIELEKKAAQPMPGAVEVLSRLKSIGKRVICISDSYLSVEQMSAILEHHGSLRYIDKLYVSCEVGKRKSTGRLFQYVIEKEGEKIVHIGDNYDSDYIMPRRLGIRALSFHSRSEQGRKSKLKTLLDSENKMNYVNAIVRSPAPHKSELQRVGYEVLGPALTVFVHNVAEQARKDSVEALFFVARDGYALKKIYEILRCTIYVASALPPGRYMCLGRLPVRLASLHELGYADILKVYGYIARFPGRSVSLGDIMGSYGLEPEGFVNIAKQFGLDLNEPITNPAQDERVHRLLKSDDFQRMVREKSDAARGLLRDYLDSIGFMGKKKVAVVDANAEGLTQSITDMIFSGDANYPAVRRYYFNLLTLNVDTAGIKPVLSEALGIVTDWRSDSTSDQALFRFFGLLIELFSHPNHGVTVGYRRAGGRIVPLFRKTPQEREYPVTSQGLQGILDYTGDYGMYYGLHNYTSTQLLGDVKSNVRGWVLHPSKTDVAPLKHLSFTSDWPVETNHRLMQQVTAWDIVTIRGLRKKVRSSSWAEGTLTLAPASWFSRILYRATATVRHKIL